MHHVGFYWWLSIRSEVEIQLDRSTTARVQLHKNNPVHLKKIAVSLLALADIFER